MNAHVPSAASSEDQNLAPTKKGRKPLLICVGVVVLIVLLVGAAAATTIGVYKRLIPPFTLDDVSVYPCNSSESNDCRSNSRLLVTLSSTNPSGKNDVYYGKLAVYLSMKGKTTQAAFVDGMLQKPKEIATWTVILDTNGEIASAAQAEKATGSIRADGWIQWKIGSLYIFKNKIHVECPVIFNFKDRSSAAEKPMRPVIDSRCSVHH